MRFFLFSQVYEPLFQFFAKLKCFISIKNLKINCFQCFQPNLTYCGHDLLKCPKAFPLKVWEYVSPTSPRALFPKHSNVTTLSNAQGHFRSYVSLSYRIALDESQTLRHKLQWLTNWWTVLEGCRKSSSIRLNIESCKLAN